jgi:peptide deformylase
MIETMRDAEGVGLAAPQVGVGWQLFVYEAPGGEGDEENEEEDGEGGRGGAAIPLHVVVNPMLVPHPGELVYDWEGCLSIPGLRGLVPRQPEVRVQALDRAGGSLDYVARGFEARIVQHEYDHLNGIVFLDRMRDLRSLAFTEEWERYLLGGGGDDAPPAVG